jgi:signal recognition particle GTPase
VVARVETLGRSEPHVHPLDLAARVIGEVFPRVVVRMPRTGPALLSVLGSRGSGKSSFVRKMALRLSGAGRRVSVLVMRQRESSKPEWLATWLGEAGAFACVVEPGELVPSRALHESDVVLVDGAGDPSRDAAFVEAVARSAGAQRAVETRIGVLAADSAPDRLRAELRALRAIGTGCCVLSRLDLAAAPAAALELASAATLPIAFVTDGVEEALHLHRCGPERAADVFLKGRIA